MTRRIAMWSGPRNISTAMMRSFENRADCEVVDEPFYAFYLSQTNSPHPMFEEVIKSQPTKFNEVVTMLTSQRLESEICYQKHMTHHMLPSCDLTWCKELSHAFLIRDPAYVVNSYTNKRGECTAEDIGIKRQYEIFKYISELTGKIPPVIDSGDVLNQPFQTLYMLCDLLNIPFSQNMLSWPEGRRASDGIWANHWYKSVEASTGFTKQTTSRINLSSEAKQVVDEVMPYYEEMSAFALR